MSHRYWAGYYLVLQHHTDDQKHEVKSKHGEPQQFVHFPFTGSNRNNHKEEHEEKEDNCTKQTIAADCYRAEAIEDRKKEPGNWQPARKGQVIEINVLRQFICCIITKQFFQTFTGGKCAIVFNIAQYKSKLDVVLSKLHLDNACTIIIQSKSKMV